MYEGNGPREACDATALPSQVVNNHLSGREIVRFAIVHVSEALILFQIL